jgi:hypothetical protein
VVYGQYTTGKGLFLGTTQRRVYSLYTARSLGILAIYHKPQIVPHCYYKLVTNVIRAVKINVVIPVVYGLIYHYCQPISIQGSNHPVYNTEHDFAPG